jgi:hypothetical protein
LPKLLDIKEQLSVQGHPAGNTEVYIIVDAEPGATLRLGFKRDIDAGALAADLEAGLERQRKLIDLLSPGADLHVVQQQLQPWLADRNTGTDGARRAIAGLLPGDSDPPLAAVELLAALKQDYWQMLDLMNEIELEAGMVIHNATPPRLLRQGEAPSAEVHALGNPERREVLALEIRRPGPTFRAWDNVRFPPRAVDVAAALAAVNLRATQPDEFLCQPVPVPGRPGVSCSVDSAAFRIEHLTPSAGTAIELAAAQPYCLHVLAGEVSIGIAKTGAMRVLGRGESALVPIGAGAGRMTSAGGAQVICVRID